MKYTPEQENILRLPPDQTVFLQGPAGAGKTTVGIARLMKLLEEGVPPSSILVLVPQRSLGAPYIHAVETVDLEKPAVVEPMTMNGLAQRMVDLFWPLVGDTAGFRHPELPPVFLTMETAQFYMAALAQPLLQQGYFESITMNRNRLYSQVLDNLNKSAVVGIPLEEIGDRLSAAWLGEPGQKRIYSQAQELAVQFRKYCLENNLLDFSLQVEVFKKYLWPADLCQKYVQGRFQHLIYDNIEEDTPFAHDVIQSWLPKLASGLMIFDTKAGYRLFLGADPDSAHSLKENTGIQVELQGNLNHTPAFSTLYRVFNEALGHPEDAEPVPGNPGTNEFIPPVTLSADPRLRFHTEMIDWVTAQVERLVTEQGVPPREIAILSPFLNDALRFDLAIRLQAKRIPFHVYRPSRGLRDEWAVRCLVVLAKLAHPSWQLAPSNEEVATSLIQIVDGLDLVRGRLLADILYSRKASPPRLGSFQQILPEKRERIGYEFGARFDHLREWLAEYQAGEPLELDHFWSRLFGEILSQPGYGFHRSLDQSAAVARLIESMRKFRMAVAESFIGAEETMGKAFIEMVGEGVISAQYQPQSWADEADAVLIAPAFSFLMRNKPVDVQLWLDVGSLGWWERLNQPLTQPYVLSRGWPAGRPWTDADEFNANQEMLDRLVVGLLRRCRAQLFLGFSDLSVQGYEQQGPLMKIIQKTLRSLSNLSGGLRDDHV